jgi:hypothetical protein
MTAREGSAGTDEAMTGHEHRYVAALAVVLVDAAQCIPYGTVDLTLAHLGPWELAITSAFILVTLLTALAAFTDRMKLFTQAVYFSGGLYAIACVTLLSATEIRTQPRLMLGITFAGITVGLFTLWLTLRRIR